MICQSENSAKRRYRQRLIPTFVLYLVFVVTATWIFHHRHPAGIPAYLLALSPALPLVGIIVIMGLYLAEEKDEFQRSLSAQSMLWGIGGLLVLATVWGFLELFTSVPHFQVYLAFPLFWFFAGLAEVLLRRRYR